MGTLQKLKAYFGMVPADDEFDDGYDPDPADGYRSGYGHRPGYLGDDDYGHDGYEPYSGPARPRPAGAARAGYRDRLDAVEPDMRDEEFERTARSRPRAPWAAAESPVASVHGALAMETRREPVTRLRAEPTAQSRQSSSYPLGRIVTLHPTSYNEARAIGEHYRDGSPVIMNLTAMDDADAKRLVDFAAGLAFALRGAIDKVTSKVFLISPPNVDPSAEDKRRIAEGGLFTRD
jgi:cell division inhibitor SepF